MRPTEVSDDEIIQAGKQVVSEGHNVTGFRLRKIIGKGTPTRLVSVWNAYTNKQNPPDIKNETTGEATLIPDNANKSINDVVDNISQHATSLISTMFENLMADSSKQQQLILDDLKIQHDKQLIELNSDIEERDLMIEDLSGQQEELTSKNSGLEDSIVEKEQLISELNAKIVQLEADNKKLSEKKDEVAESRDKMVDENKTLTKHLHELQTNETNLKGQLKDAQQHVVQFDSLKEQLSKKHELDTQYSALQATNEQLSEQLIETKEELKTIKDSEKQLQSEVATLRYIKSEYTELKDEYKKANNQLQQLIATRKSETKE